MTDLTKYLLERYANKVAGEAEAGAGAAEFDEIEAEMFAEHGGTCIFIERLLHESSSVIRGFSIAC